MSKGGVERPDSSLAAALSALLDGMLHQEAAADSLLSTLAAEAADGDTRAKAILRHPWGTTQTPKRAIERIRAGLRGIDEDLVQQAPHVLALFLRRRMYVRQLEQAAEKGGATQATGTLAGKLASLGIGDWMIDRLSQESTDKIGEVIKEAGDTTKYYHAVSMAELESRGLLERVSQHQSRPPVPIKPTRAFLSVHAGVDQDRRLPAFCWDGEVSFAEHKTFYRKAFPGECDPDEWFSMELPPYRSVEEFVRHDDEFARCLADARNKAGHMESRWFGEASIDEKLPHGYWQSILTPSDDQVRFSRRIWWAYRPFAELGNAIYSYQHSANARRFGFEARDWLMSTWIFLLAGRSFVPRSNAELVVRRRLFDFTILPVFTWGEPAFRVLIPRDLLTKRGPGGTGAASSEPTDSEDPDDQGPDGGS